MTNLIMIGISFVAGLAIGGGAVMMWINQRKVPLDKWTDRYKVNADALANADTRVPIGILDTACDPPFQVCQVTMFTEEQHERVGFSQWVEEALNSYRG